MTQKDWNVLFNAVLGWSLVALCTLFFWTQDAPHVGFICSVWVVFNEQIAAFIKKWWRKLSSVRWRV